jgi:hypothetical protein
MRRSAGRTARIGVVCIAALVVSSCGEDGSAVTVSASGVPAEVEGFDAFEVFWLGESFEDMPLTAVALPGADTSTTDVSFIYGDCDASRDACAPPLEVQVWPACERNRSSFTFDGEPTPSEPMTVRGTTADLYDDGDGGGRLEIATGEVTVVIFSSVGRLVPAADALRSVTGVPGPADDLEPPAPGAIEGELVCAG